MGPTIPFLLGGLETPVGAPFKSERAAKARLRALLMTIQEEAGTDYAVRLIWCAGTQAHVLTPSAFTESFGWDPIDGCLMPDLDGLIEVLWVRYGEPIRTANYSIDDRLWHEFTSTEIAKIKSTLLRDR